MNPLVIVAAVLLGLFSLGAVNLSDIGKTFEQQETGTANQDDENNTFFNMSTLTNKTKINITDGNCSNFLINTKFTIAQKAGLYLCKAETFVYNTLSRWTDPFHFIFLVLIAIGIYALILKGSVKGSSMIEHIVFLGLIIIVIIILVGGV